MREYKCLVCDKSIESLTLPQDWAYCVGNRFICRECIMNCKVSDLGNFPFDNFQDFQEAHRLRVVKIGVDMGTAREWAMRKGWHAPQKAGRIPWLLLYLLYLVVIGFVIYSIVTKSWLFLLSLPLFLLAIFVFHPGAKSLGLLRTVLVILVHFGFIYSIVRYNPNWLAITLVLIIIFYTQQAMYRIASDSLIKAILKHEDLLCVLWLEGRMNVIYKHKFFAEPLSRM